MAKKVPVRLCLGCREPRAKNEMLRIVRTAEGEIMLDRKGKLSGRGAYICPSRACFDKARKSKALERSLKVTIPDEIYDSLAAAIETAENG